MDTSKRQDASIAGDSTRRKRSALLRLRLALMKPVMRQVRGMTLGARTAVIDGAGRFLLVRHTYSPGWIFPGGGVERGESCLAAAIRELREEAAITPEGPLVLHGIFNNHRDFPGDHLAFFVLRAFRQDAFKPNMEIAEARFFAADALPDTLTGGSHRRILELAAGATVSEDW